MTELLRSWRTAAALLLMAALGAGASGALAGLVTAVISNPLDLDHPERVVSFRDALPSLAGDFQRPDEMVDYQDMLPGVVRMAVYSEHDVRANLEAAGRIVAVSGAEVSAEFFETLGLSIVSGRPFRKSDFRPVQDRVVILADDLNRQLYGDRGSSPGSTVRLNDVLFTVIGVAPQGMRFPRGAEFWIPVPQAQDRVARGPYIGYAVIGSLRDGMSLAQARSSVERLVTEASQRSPASWPTHRKVTVAPLADDVTGPMKPALEIIALALFLVWFAAAANIAAMLRARAAQRNFEAWLRRALGASPLRLVRQRLTEAGLLAVAGLVCSLAAAVLSVEIVGRLMPSGYGGARTILPTMSTVWLSVILAIVAGGIAVLPDIRDILRRRDCDTAPRPVARSHQSAAVSSWPILVQTAAAMVLVTGTVVLARSVARLQDVDLGFRPDGVMTASVLVPAADAAGLERRHLLYKNLIDRLQALPGVVAAGATSALPLSRTDAISLLFSVDGLPNPGSFKDRFALSTSVTPGYFRAMGIDLINGRVFDDHDRADSQRVLIVNQTLARRYGGATAILGKQISLPHQSADVVGVVGDVRHWGAAQDAGPQIYAPQTQASGAALNTLVVKTTSDVALLSQSIRSIVAELNPGVAVYDTMPLSDLVGSSTRGTRETLTLVALFATVSLTLAGVGLFAALSQFVSSRQREIGVRVALGASRADVSRLVIGQAVALAVVGAGLGAGAAFLILRLISAKQFGIVPLSVVELALAALILVSVAVTACLSPTVAALRVDPVALLRSDS